MESILHDHKGVIVIANKSDLGRQADSRVSPNVQGSDEKVFHFFIDVPVVFTSAETGYGVDDMLDKIEQISDKINMRISTSDLNDFFFETIRKAPAPVWGITNVKFYYLTQTTQKPPAFIAFANHPESVLITLIEDLLLKT